jgi:type IV pilus assembly protein PilM
MHAMEYNALWSSLKSRIAGWKPALPALGAPAPIGFDLASERLNLAQASLYKGGWHWRAIAALPYPGGRSEMLGNPAAFRTLVQTTLHEHGFRGRRVVSVLPPGDLQVISIDYTTTNGQDDTAVLLRTLKERFKSTLDDTVLDILPVRRPRDSNLRSAVVALAPRNRVLAHLDLLTAAELEPEAIDIGPAALARLARAVVTGDPRANLLLINFGTENSYFSLLWGRRLMFDRSLAIGEKRLAGTLASNLDLSLERALALLRKHGLNSHGDEIAETIGELLQPDFQYLALEVNRVLIYFASQTHGGAVEGIYLAGSIARLPGAADFLCRLLSMPVQVLNPWKIPGSEASKIIEPPTGMAVAAGLALRGIPLHGRS